MKLKTSVFFIICSLFVSEVFAQELPFDSMNGFPSPKTRIDYSGWTEPVETMNNNRAAIQFSLYHSEDQSLRMSLRGSHMSVPKGISIPGSSSIEVPESLSSADVGFTYTQKLSDNRTIGGGFSLGSASDELFSSKDSTTIGANFFYSFPSEQNDRWVWALFYSNNNPVFRDYPIPAVAYFYQRPTVMGAVGLPFIFVRWTPDIGPWAFTLFNVVTIVKAEAAYGPQFMQYFLGFDWNQQTWLRRNVQDTDNKLYYDEKKISLGTRFLLAKFVFTEIAVGQSFDRSFYEGQGLGREETVTAFVPTSWFAS